MSHVEDVLEDHPLALPGGTMMNEYRIDAVLGQGGFGITYLAYDTLLDEQVAIKEYFPSDNAVRTRELWARARTAQGRDLFRAGLTAFLDEARIIARFRQTNIMQVRRFFETRGTGYIVLNYEVGRSLEDVMADGPLPEDALLSIVKGILCGLEMVHERAVLHRDLKPRNVIVRDDGTPVLLDFGAARDFSLRNSFTVTQIASSGYSPPEQYGVSDQHGPWSDFYALGSIMYRGVTGRVPVESLSRLRDDPLTPASKAAAGRYSPALLRTIDRMMQVDETRRPVSVAGVRTLLPSLDQVRTVPLAAFPGLPVSVPVVHDWTRLSRRARDSRRLDALVSRTRRLIRRTALLARALPHMGVSRRPARATVIAGISVAALLVVGGGVLFARHRADGTVVATQVSLSAIPDPGGDPAQPAAPPAAAAVRQDAGSGSSAGPERGNVLASQPSPGARDASLKHAQSPSSNPSTAKPSLPAPSSIRAAEGASRPTSQGVAGPTGTDVVSGAAQVGLRGDLPAGTTIPTFDARGGAERGTLSALGRSDASTSSTGVTPAGAASPWFPPPDVNDLFRPDEDRFSPDDDDGDASGATFTADTIPFLSPADRLNAAIGLARGGRTALALSTDGRYGLASGQDSSYAARDLAMMGCVTAGGADCELYEADDQLLWPQFSPSVTTSFFTGLHEAATPPGEATAKTPVSTHAQHRGANSRQAKGLGCGSHCRVSGARWMRGSHRFRRPAMVAQAQPTLFEYLFGSPVAATPRARKNALSTPYGAYGAYGASGTYSAYGAYGTYGKYGKSRQ